MYVGGFLTRQPREEIDMNPRAYVATAMVLGKKRRSVVDLLDKPHGYTVDAFRESFVRALVKRFGDDFTIADCDTIEVFSLSVSDD